MKQIMKRVSSVCAALFCAVTVTVSGAVIVSAADETDGTVESQVIMIAEGLTDTIIPLSEEDIDSYMNSGDAFTMSAMESWTSAKAEVGELVEAKEAEVEYSDGQYTVTVPVDFEELDANFVYVFDEDSTPTSMTVDVQYPMSYTLQRAGMNTLMGIGTVFVMLVFLSFVIYLFKFIPGLVGGNKKKEAQPQAPAPAVAAAPAAPVEEITDDTELIAVIAAAIAASEGTSTDGFVVRSIRKVNRKRR
ncbi:MAG: OadG family transporter subunit [Eubacteriales bacterium]|nr:OadG family transporter subunit [Eubacteriales bacterium]